MKRLLAAVLVTLCMFSLCATPVLAADENITTVGQLEDAVEKNTPEAAAVPVPQLRMARSDIQYPIVYSDGSTITCDTPTPEELRISANYYSKPHIYELPKDGGQQITPRHASITPHTHAIVNVRSTARKYTQNLSGAPLKNTRFKESSSWPTISYTRGRSFTVSGSCSLSVGVPVSVAQAQIGASFGVSSTWTAGTTYTYKIPFRTQGYIANQFTRNDYTFTCKTTYYYRLGTKPWSPVKTVVKTGSGSGKGGMYNATVNLITQSI